MPYPVRAPSEAIANAGLSVIIPSGWSKTLIYIVLAPMIGLILAFVLMVAIFWIDIDTMLILDTMTYPALLGGIALSFALLGQSQAAWAAAALMAGSGVGP